MKCEKNHFKGRRRVRWQDSEILNASREKVVNKTWVKNSGSGLTIIVANWRLHLQFFNVNKQLIVYPKYLLFINGPPLITVQQLGTPTLNDKQRVNRTPRAQDSCR